MDITFNCDKCGQHIAIDEVGAGKFVNCPKCFSTQLVPANPAGQTKKCPFCAETIHADAIKCKHCGEFLNGTTREQRSPNTPPTKAIIAHSGTSNGYLICFGLVGALVVIWILYHVVYLPYNIRKKSLSEGEQILNDCRAMDWAIDQWAVETGRKNGETIVTTDAARYLKGAWPDRDAVGNFYEFTVVGPTQVLIDANSKGSLSPFRIDWGKY